MTLCRQVAHFLMDYDPANETDPPTRVQFHLARCAACRTEVLHYRKTVQLARAAMFDPEPDLPFPERLVRSILARERDGSRTESATRH